MWVAPLSDLAVREESLADNNTSSNATADQVKLVLTVFSTFGLGSIVIVIVGRLWTSAYFEHFGLSAADLEFSVEDFAFRSLEVLISLGLAGLGLILAWRAKSILPRLGLWVSLLEIAVVAGAVFFMFWLLELGVSWAPWLASPGILGIISGTVLIVMVFLAADIWFGPGENQEAGRDEEHPETLKDVIGWLKANWQRPLAAIMMMAIIFVYLPLVTRELAQLQAEIDLEEGRLPAAILESNMDPLPDAIASSTDPTRSNPVRVILTQSQNTYVLHSTECTTIGELEATTIRVGGFLPPEAPDVCRVFTIPTRRLKSIEYLQVRGRAPANESALQPLEIDVAEEGSLHVFDSQGASDEEALKCEAESEGRTESEDETKTHFFNSVWYEFAPATNGTVLTRAETSDFEPAIGIWAAPQEESTNLEGVAGSGTGTGLACETASVPVSAPGDGEDGADQRSKNVVGVVANVQAGTRYLVSVGALDDRGGSGSVFFRFTPGGHFFNPAAGTVTNQPVEDEALLAEDLVPRVEIVSDEVTAAATLKLWRLKPETYELQAFADIPVDDRDEFMRGEFVVESGEEQRKFLEKTSEGEEQPPELTAEGLGEGVWKLAEPEGFVGLALLNVTVHHPDLTLAFADTSDPPLKDGCVQRAILLVLEESSIREELGYEGNVIFDPESLDADCETSEAIEDATTSARRLLEEAGVEGGFPIQIQVEEERETLRDAAEIVQQRLLDIGLDAGIEPCIDACIRVFFGSEGL